MATRYKWEKFNFNTQTSYEYTFGLTQGSTAVTSFSKETQVESSESWTLYSDISINSSTGQIYTSGSSQSVESAVSGKNNTYTSATLKNMHYIYNAGLCYKIDTLDEEILTYIKTEVAGKGLSATTVWEFTISFYPADTNIYLITLELATPYNLYQISTKVVDTQTVVTNTQGDISYGYVYSNLANAYPLNGVSDSYWYVYIDEEQINNTCINGTIKDIKSILKTSGTVKTDVNIYQSINGAIKQT